MVTGFRRCKPRFDAVYRISHFRQSLDKSRLTRRKSWQHCEKKLRFFWVLGSQKLRIQIQQKNNQNPFSQTRVISRSALSVLNQKTTPEASGELLSPRSVVDYGTSEQRAPTTLRFIQIQIFPVKLWFFQGSCQWVNDAPSLPGRKLGIVSFQTESRAEKQCFQPR